MNLEQLPTEKRNPDTLNIDEVSTTDMLRLINNEDKKVAFYVEEKIDQIAKAVDMVSEIFAAGGRIIYCGAGTSGRMGYMDSAECPPTFGIDHGRVVSIIAGGHDAMAKAKEGAEDKKEPCVEELKKLGFSNKDVLVGIAASGRTPFVIGGMEYAREIGAKTISITCNDQEDCEINRLADIPIAVYAGPEAITGSTRMKAGTAQKLVLNMLSTGVMIKTGKVYGNLMVNVKLSNEKLVDRGKRIIAEITGASEPDIVKALDASNNDVSTAIFMLMTGCSADEAKKVLEENKGQIKKALASYK